MNARGVREMALRVGRKQGRHAFFGDLFMKILCFLTLLLSALSIVPGMAHVLEMHSKMELTQESYGTVQYIYHGWAFLGILQGALLLCTLILLLRVSQEKSVFLFTLIAFLFQIFAFVVFFTFTYPVNVATNNWTVVPVEWERLRQHWEYSHMVGAILQLLSYILLVTAVLRVNSIAAGPGGGYGRRDPAQSRAMGRTAGRDGGENPTDYS